MIHGKMKGLADQMSARVDEIYADGAIIFLSGWTQRGTVDGVNFIRGEGGLVSKCFEETERDIRLLEECNLGNSARNGRRLQGMLERFGEEADPELESLFRKVEPLVTNEIAGDGSPFFGQVLMIVGWMELGMIHHRYVDFCGMIPGIVRLFNLGRDSFRKAHHREDWA